MASLDPFQVFRRNNAMKGDVFHGFAAALIKFNGFVDCIASCAHRIWKEHNAAGDISADLMAADFAAGDPLLLIGGSADADMVLPNFHGVHEVVQGSIANMRRQ